MAVATEKKVYTWGTGRRKTAVARVRICEGTGQFQVNGHDANTYFPLEVQQTDIRAPLKSTEMGGRVDVIVNVTGSSKPSQSGAVMQGLARRSRNSAPTSTLPFATVVTSPAMPAWSSARSSATRKPARASSSRSVESKPMPLPSCHRHPRRLTAIMAAGRKHGTSSHWAPWRGCSLRASFLAACGEGDNGPGQGHRASWFRSSIPGRDSSTR